MKNKDTIYRQAAIDVLSQYPFEKVVNCLSILEELPSAQPEQDVLAWLLSYHAQAFELKGRYLPHEVIGWLVNDFGKAFMAERREE